MLQFNPNDPGDTPYKLQRAIKESGMTLQQVCDRLESDYDVKLLQSSLSRSISRETLATAQKRATKLFEEIQQRK